MDHGKTTLSDCLLEATSTVDKRAMKECLLDAMDLERERGITIKCHPVSMLYQPKGSTEPWLYNLIDTPGHVDFAYEVSRSLAACEGALLLVDAAQGIEAQTVANAHLAINQGLTVIPVINKIDLPGAEPEKRRREIEDILAIPAHDALLASGKARLGISEILEAVAHRLPGPRWGDYPQTRMLIFDCAYDAYRGVICYVRVFSGLVRANDMLMMMSDGQVAQVKEVGVFSPQMRQEATLGSGQVGYIVTNLREVSQIKIGDTLTHLEHPAQEMLPGYKEIQPMVFSGIYPIDSTDYEKLKASVAKLRLNDAAFTYQSESSTALGFGFRCGFLGLLHMDIVQERLRREYDLDIISTYPSVVYRIETEAGKTLMIDNPLKLPDPTIIKAMYEPTVKATIIIPNICIGELMTLISEKRGIYESTESIDTQRVILSCTLPLNEILVDFHDRLKSITKGYGSMDYCLGEYIPSKLTKLEILVNTEPVDAFASIVHASKAESRGRSLCERLGQILPRQMFKIAIQAAVGGKIVARETINAFRKDVTAKCYGGDISRKRKLLDKQKEGKKRMKRVGKVDIPQETFVQILKNQ